MTRRLRRLEPLDPEAVHVALAREVGADKLVTTDRDFERLCEDEPFAYTNPVPEDVLSEFDTTT